jgi:hypothetical protein
MDFNSKLDALTNRDIELNEQYNKELIETRDVQGYDLKMEFKTKWFKLELYNLINNKDEGNKI